ncbi:MAG TPA: peptidylprolyl isomerase [Janthinobacterium sp.]|nr:peptidylprolyl isomerase [Janthinobacterium sp.]
MKSMLQMIAALFCAFVLAACGGARGGVTVAPPDPATQPAAFVVTDTLLGSGAVAAAGDTVSVSYTGWLYNSGLANSHAVASFDSSAIHGSGGPFTFTLGVGAVIPGWDQGVAGMAVGGKRTLVIPSALAYGPTATANIPAYAGLVFDVELVSVIKKTP